MDRGFGNYYRGKNNPRRDDKRYDEFYSDRDRRGGGSFRGNRNGGNRGGNRDRGFFDNQGNHNNNAGQNSVIAALQLQNQNLLSAYIRNQNQTRGNVFNQQGSRNRNYNQGGGFKSGDKRRQDSGGPSNFKKSKQASNNRESERKTSSRGSSSSRRESTTPKKDEIKKLEEEIPDIPDDQVEIPENIMENVEKLRQRKDVERNVADEDIEKLIVFSYNGKGYDCLTCGFMLMKDVAFKSHLMSKSHVMNVIDARSDKKYQSTRDLLDIDLSPDDWFEKNETAKKIILKQAKLLMKIDMDKKKRELENFNRNPANFFSVNMASKKSATMTGDVVRITSIVESTIDVKEFSKDRFFGCEFVKSVASFQCRLCDIKIHNASEVLPHIDSRVHRNKYQMHLKRVPDYEKKQMEQNKELGLILKEYEGQPVLLSETNTANPSEEDSKGKTLLEEMDAILVRVPEILNPPAPKKEEEEQKETPKEGETKKVIEETKEVEEEKEANCETKEKIKEEPMETNQSEETSKTAEVENIAKIIEPKVENEQEETQTELLRETPYEVPAEKPEEASAEHTKSEVTVEESKEEKSDETPSPSETKPKRSVKKGTAVRGRGTARRGTPKRSRGGKSVFSPKVKTPEINATEEQPPQQENESFNDGNFMDGFQIVDEVQED